MISASSAYRQNLNEMQQRFTDFQVAAEARASGTGTGVTSGGMGSSRPLNRSGRYILLYLIYCHQLYPISSSCSLSMHVLI